MAPSSLRLAAMMALCGVWLAACNVPPELRPPPGTTVPRPSPSPTVTPGATPPGATRPTAPPRTESAPTSAPGFAEETAVSCGVQVTANDVIAVVRANGLLAAATTATVTTGPLCAGTWQYAVLSVPERDALQVVTRGTPGALRLVTAGTQVCTVEVRVHAPPGIRSAAACTG